MTLQGHPRSLILAPIESAYHTGLPIGPQYSNLSAILPHFRDIRAFVRQKPLFRIPPLFQPKFWEVSLEVDP